MNENIDLTKILDGCPIGTKFYSTLQGEVGFIKIDISAEHPIIVSVHNTYRDVTIHDSYAKDGRYNSFYDGECILFPSKEQRDWSKFVRFWDKPKTEKFDPKTFQPFDKVLVKDYAKDVWKACLFSHHADELDNDWYVCDNTYWRFIIPYNDETKHLVGTKDDSPEYYKWWEE